MTQIPRDPTNYNVQMIPIETVQAGYSLMVDRGAGRQLFQVEETECSSKQQDDGSYLTVWKLTSTPVAGGGDPWVIERPVGTMVCRILGPSARQ